MKRGQELIKAVGMKPERIALLNASSSSGGHPYTEVCSAFSERVKEMGMRQK